MGNHKKAFGLIGLLITLAIIALASWSTYSSFLKPKDGSEAPIEQGLSAINEAEKVKQLLEQRNIITEPNNLPSIHAAKVGDKVASFTITSITIFPFIYPSDQSQDFRVEYVGETTVRGNYFWSQMLDRVCFMVSEEDALNIPRMKEDSKGANFCFSNTNFAKQALAPVLVAGPKGDGVKHPATVVIHTYTEIVASKEGSDLTLLITVTQ